MNTDSHDQRLWLALSAAGVLIGVVIGVVAWTGNQTPAANQSPLGSSTAPAQATPSPTATRGVSLFSLTPTPCLETEPCGREQTAQDSAKGNPPSAAEEPALAQARRQIHSVSLGDSFAMIDARQTLMQCFREYQRERAIYEAFKVQHTNQTQSCNPQEAQSLNQQMEAVLAEHGTVETMKPEWLAARVAWLIGKAELEDLQESYSQTTPPYIKSATGISFQDYEIKKVSPYWQKARDLAVTHRKDSQQMEGLAIWLELELQKQS